MDEDEVGFTDSDGEFEEDDQLLLDELKKREQDDDGGNETAVYGFEDEDDDDDDLDMGSDLDEAKEYLPDDRAWGKRKKDFYHTDFDKDYSGAYGAEDAEIAEMEEQEARNIQKRLMEQLSDADFSLADIIDTPIPQSDAKTEIIQTDLSQLTKRQKLELFRKEAPEFDILVNDFQEKIDEVRMRLVPVMKLVKDGKLKDTSAVDFVVTKYRLILNYCTNIIFYVLLKAKRIPVKDHPVLKVLFRYRQLLQQMQPVDDEIIAPQIDKILQVLSSTTPDEPGKVNDLSSKKKNMLKILKKPRGSKKETEPSDSVEVTEPVPDIFDDSNSEEEEGAEGLEEDSKRAISYEMAKNKGLTPKRSKEQRNPRVKHRNKFRKSLIRRRGQVRTPRKEIPLYGGEPTGIKIGLKKGRKFK